MGMGMDMDTMIYGDLENDEDLEAELRALQEGDGGSGAKMNRTAKGR